MTFFFVVIGMVFQDVTAFRAALNEHVVRAGIRITRVKNEAARVTVVCAARRCTWRIHASPIVLGEPSFMVKSHTRTHTCVRANHTREVSYKWVAEKLVPILRNNPKLSLDGIKAELKKYNVEPPYMTIWRGKIGRAHV